MLNLLISCDDPIERLLYGEPDPWLEQMNPRDNPRGNPGEPGGSATLPRLCAIQAA